MRLQKTYAKSVWLSKLKAKVNLVEQGSLLSMSLQMWKTVMWFSFFSMIKRMLQPSKSMLSSNLCETWDLILNESIKGCIVFLIYFFCPSQDILGISVNHLYKRLKGVCQNSHPLLKYHKARTFTSSGFAIPYFFCTFMERNF